jgi:hypothetical protein
MIELIDLDTGATMEVHGDKVSGLQFSGEPTERALRAKRYIFKQQVKVIRLDNLIKEKICYSNLKDELTEQATILEALKLMAEERR